MSETQHSDIVIVGAGIAGLTLAAMLRGNGLGISLLDRRLPAAPTAEPELRVSAISRSSLELLGRCGVLDVLLAERATAFEQMHVWDASGAGEIHFDSADTGLETLGYIIENSRIQQALLEQCRSADDVDIVVPANIESITTQDGPRLLLDDGRQIDCGLLVGADGVESAVRQAAAIEFSRGCYHQRGLVCVVATEQRHRHTAWQVFLADGPLAFLPLYRQDGRDLCSIVWTLPEDRAAELTDAADAEFIAALEQAFQYRLGALQLVSARAAFPLQHGHAEHYVRERVALIGDAAHIIHPLAGQGANLGIADAAALADVVLGARDAGRNWSALHTLRSYERDRKGANLLMETAMTGFNKLFSNDDQWLALARNAGLNIVDQASFLKHRFMKHAMGI